MIAQKDEGGMYPPYTDTLLTTYLGEKSSYISCMKNTLQAWQYKRKHHKMLK